MYPLARPYLGLTRARILFNSGFRYSAPLYVDMKKSVFRAPSDEDPVEATWEHEEEEDEEQKIFIGKVRLPSRIMW